MKILKYGLVVSCVLSLTAIYPLSQKNSIALAQDQIPLDLRPDQKPNPEAVTPVQTPLDLHPDQKPNYEVVTPVQTPLDLRPDQKPNYEVVTPVQTPLDLPSDQKPNPEAVTTPLKEWRVSLTTKSYIPKFFSVGWLGSPGAEDRAKDFAAVLKNALNGGDIIKNENPDDEEYRLFTRANMSFICDGDKISDVVHYDLYWTKKRGLLFDDNTRVGNEGKMTIGGVGTFQFGPESGIIIENESKRVDASTWKFKWKYKGRPSPVTEPLFNYVPYGLNGINRASRTSVYIWHLVEGECFCKGGIGYWKVNITGSAFPSHAAWFFDQRISILKPTKDLMAQDIDNLWQPFPGKFDEVVSRSLNPKSLSDKGQAR